MTNGARFLALAAFAVAATACGTHATAPPPPTTSTQTPHAPVSPAPMALTVFEVSNGVLRPRVVHVPRTQAVATAALGALSLAAPVSVASGTATVDLPKATDIEVAEIVFTLTQFATIHRVDVAGRKGLTRDDVATYLPPILVEAPATGASVSQTFHVSGTASVFEATLVVQLVRDGKVIEKQTVSASEGAPGRGTFDATMHATPGALTVQAFAPSAADGSPQHEVDIDVTVTP